MPVRSLKVLQAALGGEAGDHPKDYATPTLVDFPPEPGVTPSAKPPVRIFMGTEGAQFRAERVLVWSVLRHRDPARHYQIHLMKNLAGFPRHMWLTGFTNYRFAIPEYAGFEGRAIWNDVDQIYLKDPALLFDTEMGEHGYMSINRHDTSVMLMDCARMKDIWNKTTARAGKRRDLDDAGLARPGLWGQIDGGWNARDVEYNPDTSHCVHFTTIHKQPWRPVPGQYVYQANPTGDLWPAMEREADAAGFFVFDDTRPSPRHAEARAAFEAAPETAPGPARTRLAEVRGLLDAAGRGQVAYLGHAGDESLRATLEPGALTRLAPADLRLEVARGEISDAVICDGYLSALPDWDATWTLEALFRRAGKVLSVLVDLRGDVERGLHRRDPLWWYQQMAAAAVRHPGVHWQLLVFRGARLARQWQGGAALHEVPKVWVLDHYKTGHHTQARDLAGALGWPFETVALPKKPAGAAAALIRARITGSVPGFLPQARAWPDMVIGSGWLGGHVARFIGRASGGRTRVVTLGRRGGPAEEAEDVSIACRHYRLVHHPRRIETLLPTNRGVIADLANAPATPGKGAKRRLVALVGGASRSHAFGPATAEKLAAQLRALADPVEAEIFVVTSRRTGAEAERALRASLGGTDVVFHAYSENPDRAPLLEALRTADAFVVTGESESMLAEAAATGRPVHIFPVPRRRPDPIDRLSAWVERRALTPVINRRGTPKPQEGINYICNRLIERGIVLPPRRVEALHEALIAEGLATGMEGPMRSNARPPRDECAEAAAQLLHLLGWPGPESPAEAERPEPRRAAG